MRLVPLDISKIFALLAGTVLLSSCAEQPPACDLTSYASLRGLSIAAVTLPADPKIRVIMPDDIVTMDFVPDRVNILVDAQGTIDEISCG